MLPETKAGQLPDAPLAMPKQVLENVALSGLILTAITGLARRLLPHGPQGAGN